MSNLDSASPFRDDLLSGSTVIVTGGGSGLGSGIVHAVARCGADVAVVGRRVEQLGSVVDELQALGRRAIAVPCDIREAEEVEACVTRVEDELGSVDHLVNNAGATFTAPSLSLSPRGFRAVVETDAFGTFYMSQAVGRRLIDRGAGGAIVNITSTSPMTGNPGRIHGGVGKAGVESMTKTLAVEWGAYGIRVNSLAPGYVPTQGVDQATNMRSASESEVMRVAASVPLGRVGRVDDIAWPVAFLLSPAASFINGATLTVDGGKWLSSGRGDVAGSAPN